MPTVATKLCSKLLKMLQLQGYCQGRMVFALLLLTLLNLVGSEMMFMPRYPFIQLPSSQKLASAPNTGKERELVIQFNPSSNIKTVVSPPLCIACRCLLGFTSCTDAGGRQFVPQSCYTGALTNLYNAGAECSYAAPASLSVCEPSCKKSCPAPADETAPQLSDCIDLPTSVKRQCNSQCAALPEGTVVSCNPAKAGVVSSLPPACSSRNQRATNLSALEGIRKKEEDADEPEIESSLHFEAPRQKRKDRAVEFFLFPTFPGLLPTETVPKVSVYRGLTTATYVASDGACLEANALDAPFC